MGYSEMARSNSISARAKVDGGWDKINRNETSILGHHLGLPLFVLFYRLEGRNDATVVCDNLAKIEYLKKYVKDVDKSKISELESIFADCFNSMEEDFLETQLTTKFAEKLIEKLPAVLLTCTREESVDRSGCRVDILLRSGLSNESRPVVLFEFGLECKKDHWWAKAYQGHMYAEQMMANNEKPENMHPRFGEKPMLLVVVTVNRAKVAWLGQIAVFLCWQKDLDNLRMSLLWRKQTDDVEEMSKAIAFTIIAGQHLDKWCNSDNEDFPCVNRNCTGFEYLGPNCCRVPYNTDQDMIRHLVRICRSTSCRA